MQQKNVGSNANKNGATRRLVRRRGIGYGGNDRRNDSVKRRNYGIGGRENGLRM
jgi:hypothetical protein